MWAKQSLDKLQCLAQFPILILTTTILIHAMIKTMKLIKTTMMKTMLQIGNQSTTTPGIEKTHSSRVQMDCLTKMTMKSLASTSYIHSKHLLNTGKVDLIQFLQAEPKNVSGSNISLILNVGALKILHERTLCAPVACVPFYNSKLTKSKWNVIVVNSLIPKLKKFSNKCMAQSVHLMKDSNQMKVCQLHLPCRLWMEILTNVKRLHCSVKVQVDSVVNTFVQTKCQLHQPQIFLHLKNLILV
mmetsp:Transcript_13215/g.19924  ORF Transcript_13215/g.19924 Transcript_13215/m.19924 type:complete len:243 (+) Transcript_13215:813-1541(+)